MKSTFTVSFCKPVANPSLGQPGKFGDAQFKGAHADATRFCCVLFGLGVQRQASRTCGACFLSVVAIAGTLCLSINCPEVVAHEQLVAHDFDAVKSKAEALAKRFGGPSHVLVVLDIDNTLLEAEENFGSDQWFSWQAALLEHAPDSKYLVAEDKQSLVRIWTDIAKDNQFRLTQESVPTTINAIGSQSFSLLILSARPAGFADVTRRSLREHNIDVSEHAIKMPNISGATFNPAEGIVIDQEFTPNERVRFHITSFSPIHFSDGLCLCDGQNKGTLLRMLLRRTESDIKAVLFVDDMESNTNAVFDALRDTKIDVTTIRYSRKDERVRDFLHGDKQRVHRQWRRFKNSKAALNPNRCSFETAKLPTWAVREQQPYTMDTLKFNDIFTGVHLESARGLKHGAVDAQANEIARFSTNQANGSEKVAMLVGDYNMIPGEVGSVFD